MDFAYLLIVDMPLFISMDIGEPPIQASILTLNNYILLCKMMYEYIILY